MLGIGRVGNIAFNEPGSRLNSTTRLILLDNASRNEASKIFGTLDNTPISSITMGVATILGAKKVYLLAWGENKAAMIKECVEGPITDTIPASYLQTHNHEKVLIWELDESIIEIVGSGFSKSELIELSKFVKKVE